MEKRKKIYLGILIPSITAFSLSMGLTIGCKAQRDIIKGNLDKKCNSIRSAQEYIEAKKNYEALILETYQKGGYTTEEYADKLDYLVSNEFIYDHSDTILSQEESQQIHQDLEHSEIANKVGVATTGTALVLGLGGALVAMKVDNDLVIKEILSSDDSSTQSGNTEDDYVYEEEHYYGA